MAVAVVVLLLAGFGAALVGAVPVGAAVDTANDPDAANAADAYDDPLANESGPVEVIVRFDPLPDPESAAEPVAELQEHADDEQASFESFAGDHADITVETEFWLANAMLVTVDADEVDTDDLLAVENVTAVHENVRVETLDTSGTAAVNDNGSAGAVERTPTQSRTTDGLDMVGAPAVWDAHDARGEGATVAVIDTGVDPSHQDIELSGWVAFNDDGNVTSTDVADATDPDGHGTHVAGTVAGGDASGTHIGVAPGATLYGIDTFGEDGAATFAAVVAGMEHATADEEVDALQMSLGANGTFSGFIRPVRNARAADKLVVAAAGNDGHETSSSPANVYDSLAVGAVRAERTVAGFSGGQSINRTAAFPTAPAEWPEHYVVPDVTAPGVAIPSAEAGTTDGYVELQGTSMAAPHVAGVAALAISATDGRITMDELHEILIDEAVHPQGASQPDDRYGHGIVDGEAVVEAALEAAPPTETPTETPTAIDPSDSADDAPGFGVVPALAALAVALVALSARRRRE
ncbi:hypothetical protein JCM17823_28580 [Halorubrum gandharaense]